MEENITPSTGEVAPAPVPPPDPLAGIKAEIDSMKESWKKERAEIESRLRSEKDRNVRDVIYKERQKSDQRINSIMASVKDPELVEKIGYAAYRAKSYEEQMSAQEEAKRQRELEDEQQFSAFIGKWKQDRLEELTDAGIKPEQVDWGDESEALEIRQKKFNKSLIKATKEPKKLEKTQEQLDAEYEAKFRKKYGLDSVETSMPAGVTPGLKQAEADYGAGKITTAQYVKIRKENGL
jgi:hypothetical protein